MQIGLIGLGRMGVPLRSFEMGVNKASTGILRQFGVSGGCVARSELTGAGSLKRPK